MDSDDDLALARTISLPQLVLYGLGTTIGAGIYALVGELAAVSGYYAPLAFVLSSALAAITALSFAELSGRYPRAGAASLYVKKGLNSKTLSTLVGLLVIVAGVVSSAALVNAFVGYLREFIWLPRTPIILGVVFFLGAVAAYGIREAVFVATTITILEVGGLLAVIVVSRDSFNSLPHMWPNFIPISADMPTMMLFQGALLAFYAFIGFEDMVDVAEEVKDVRRNLPLAIIITLVITTVLYFLIMISAVLTFPPETLSSFEAPLVDLYEHYSQQRAILLPIIGMFAIINGALIQLIMATRVIYGLSCRGQLPAVFSYVHHHTRTPLVATMVVTFCMMFLALSAGLATLATITSFLMLCVFSLVNLSLWRIKLKLPDYQGTMAVPAWLPLAGFIITSGFVLINLMEYLQG